MLIDQAFVMIPAWPSFAIDAGMRTDKANDIARLHLLGLGKA